MEKLTVKIARLVGTPNQHSWSQVHSFIPEDKEKREKRGILLAVLSFSGEEGVEAVATGREILARFHEEYYGETETKIFTQLSRAVGKIEEEFAQPERKLEIAAGVIAGEAAYLVVKGGGRILLKRNSAVQTLVKGNQEKIETASGYLQLGDLLVLGTSLVFQVLPEGGLRAALAHEEPEEVVEAIAPLVHGQKKMAGVASLVAKVEKEEVLVEEAIEPEAEAKEAGPKFRPQLSLVEQVVSRIKRLSLKLSPGIGRVYLRQREREIKQKKMILTVAVILIILLAVSVVFGSKKRETSQREQKFESLYAQVEAAIQEGEALEELNPVKAKETLLRAQAQVIELEELGVEPGRLAEIKSRLEQTISGVVKERELGELPVFFDLSLVREKGRGEAMSLSHGAGVILDPQEKRLFAFSLAPKSVEVVAGGDELEGAALATIYSDRAYVLTQKGILEVNTANKRTALVIEKDEEWGEILDLGAFGGSLYLVDKKGMIWRYPVGETGFGGKQEWFGPGVSPHLSEVVSMAIDGSIWLLKKDGKILKFTQGAPDVFGFSGLDKELKEPQALYNDDETNNLYVLDRGNSRVLVLAKSGEYQGQYLSPMISQATDLVVSEAEKKILVLVGDKVYEIGME